MLFSRVTIRLLGSDDFPATAKRQAAADLDAAEGGALSVPLTWCCPLSRPHRRMIALTRGPRPGPAGDPGLSGRRAAHRQVPEKEYVSYYLRSA